MIAVPAIVDSVKSTIDLKYTSYENDKFIEKSGKNADVLPIVAKVTPERYFLRAINNYNPETSGFIEAYIKRQENTLLIIFASSQESLNVRFVSFQISSTGLLVFTCREASSFTNTISSSSAIGLDWTKVKILSTGTAYEMYVNDVSVPFTGSTNNGRWFSSVTARSNIAIGIRKLFTPVTGTGRIAWVNVSNKNKWILSNGGKWAWDIIGNTSIRWDNQLNWVGDLGGSKELLEIGYTRFVKNNEPDEYVPFVSENTPRTTPSELASYTKIDDIQGSLINHNLAPSVIDFNPLNAFEISSALNRSNTDIFSNDARAFFYDPSNPYQWLAYDIADPKKYYNWMTPEAKGYLMSKITHEDEVVLLLHEIIVQKKPKKTSQAGAFARYCGIKTFFLRENDVFQYDVNGNLIFFSDFLSTTNFLTSPTEIQTSVILQQGTNFVSDDAWFRIPFCNFLNNNLVVGADVRHGGTSDYRNTDTGIRISGDNGNTFGSEIKIYERNTVIGEKPRKHHGTLLYDYNNNRSFIFAFEINNYTEQGIGGAGDLSDLDWDFVYKYSDDDGITWSNETSLKHLLEPTGSNAFNCGTSANGIVMKNGTLVVPIYEMRHTSNTLESGEDWRHRAAFIYSTDNGQTWQKSTLVPHQSNECNVVEYGQGNIMLFARVDGGSVNKVAFYTENMGVTWVKAKISNHINIGFVNKFGAININNKYLFSITTNVSARNDLTLFYSDALRKVFPFLLIKAGNSGYSCICSTNNHLFVTHEYGGNISLFDITYYYKYLKA